MLSSVVTSRDERLDAMSLGRGGGETPFPGGVTERRDFLDVREGVRYGVS